MVNSLKLKRYFSVQFLIQFVMLQVGLFIFALAILFAKQAVLGLSPWDVFHMGLSLRTPLSFGQASQLTGITLILVSLILGIKPGIGTVCNMFFIGLWVDLILGAKLIPEMPQYGLVAQLSFILLSLICYCFGGALYIKANLGTGPRDSLMMALVRRTGWKISLCRITIEVVACAIGWVLGGPVGLGTLILAFGIGPAVGIGFKLLKVPINKK